MQNVWTLERHLNFRRLSSSWAIDQNLQNFVLISNSRIAWLIKSFMQFLSFLDDLPQYAFISFQNSLGPYVQKS